MNRRVNEIMTDCDMYDNENKQSAEMQRDWRSHCRWGRLLKTGTFKTRPNGEKEPDVGRQGKENRQRHLRGAR